LVSSNSSYYNAIFIFQDSKECHITGGVNVTDDNTQYTNLLKLPTLMHTF